MFDRRVDELLHFSEGDDFIEFAGNLLPLHPQDRPAHEDVVAAGQFGVEPCADFQ